MIGRVAAVALQINGQESWTGGSLESSGLRDPRMRKARLSESLVRKNVIAVVFQSTESQVRHEAQLALKRCLPSAEQNSRHWRKTSHTGDHDRSLCLSQ